MIPFFDVVVLGGGPAGLTAAIVLARRGRSVVVLDRERRRGPRVGETLGPEVRATLQSIGVAWSFDIVPSVPFVGARSIWGSEAPFDRSSILNPLGEGDHVDRARFDAWLTEQAISAGATVRRIGAGFEIGAIESGWSVRSEDGEESSRFIIDARGRGTPGTFPPRQWIAFDRLVGVVGWLHEKDAGAGSIRTAEPELLIEAVSHGWWYSAPQPEGGLVATYMTDADLLDGSGRSGLAACWRSALAEASLTSDRVARAILTRELEVRRADSGFSCPDRGENWRAVGDAAFARDPLAGTGVLNALKSGIQAAQETDRHLDGDREHSRANDGPLGVSGADAALTDYLDQRAKYYRMERRWPESPFWTRRHPMDLAHVSIFLDPESTLVRRLPEPSIAALAPIEALLPPRAVRDFLRQLQTPTVAHTALTSLRQLTGPIGDIRLLAAVQLMVQSGVIQIASP